jgi:hypothetical protein
MLQSRDQIHYKPIEHEDWKLVLANYETMSLGTDQQLVKSIIHFSK